MNPKRILFASIPADGHFSPMTGIAMELKSQGHDVRWYTSRMFEEKLRKLGIPFYSFQKALEVNQFNVNEIFPERKKLKSGVPQLKFDLKNFFVYRAPEYFEDVKEIRESFPFDVFVCDVAFTGGELVQETFHVAGVSVGIIPIMSTSRDLAPSGLGMTPADSLVGRLKQSFLRFVAKNILFKEATSEYNKILRRHGLLSHDDILLFDVPARKADAFLQSGTPGFEYRRSDLPKKLKFVGPLHAYRNAAAKTVKFDWEDKLTRYEKIVLITQGTFEPDHSKLIVPALEALKDKNYLLIVATGRHQTKELREKYRQENIVIEDFIDFNYIMPSIDIYVTNGGYGGTLLAIDHGLPMVAAGINEGKNEVCARIGYFRLGINLKSEKPAPQKIRAAVERVVSDATFRNNARKLRDEFRSYDTNKLCAKYILDAIKN